MPPISCTSIGHHVPFHVAAGDRHDRADEPAARLPHGRKCLGQQLVEHLRHGIAELALDAAAAVRAGQLGIDLIALARLRRRPLRGTELGHPRFERVTSV